MSETPTTPQSEIRKTERSPKDEASLSTELAYDIFRNTYEYSQNKYFTQVNLIRAISNLRPNWIVTDEQKPEFEDLTRRKIKAFMGINRDQSAHERIQIHAQQSEARVDESINYLLPSFYKYLSPRNEGNQVSLPGLIPELTKDMMELDLGYIREGRPRNGANPHSPKGDPYASHICEHALKGKSTGIKVYDEIFALVGQNVINRLSLPKDHPQYIFLTAVPNALIEEYNAHHPDSPVPDIDELKARTPTAQGS